MINTKLKGSTIIGLSLAAVCFQTTVLAQEEGGRIWVPESHIACDREQEACFDTYGLSLGYTQIYFGDEAEAAWLEKLNNDDYPDLVLSVDDGAADCNLQLQICTDFEGVSIGITEIYFGADAAQALSDQLGDENIYVPESHIACDLTQNICFDSFGPSMGYTQIYLGEAAASAWVEKISNGDEPATVIAPEPGISCDLEEQVCSDDQGVSIGITQIYFGDEAADALVN